MSETKHTPTPWQAAEAERPNGCPTTVIERCNGKYGDGSDEYFIAECFGPDEKANAAFIVKACNAHDDLVKVLSSALGPLDILHAMHGWLDTDGIRGQARAALAKVEGRS